MGVDTTSTLSVADFIDASNGTDTLNVTVTGGNGGTTFAAADIQGVEVLNIRNVSGQINSLDASTIVGLTNVNADRATAGVTLTGLTAAQQVGIKGNDSVTVGAVSATYNAAATTNTLNISGGTKGGNGSDVTIAGVGITSATINSTGAANEIDNIELAATTEDVTINATSDLTIANGNGTGITNIAASATSTITVTGAGDVALGSVDADVDTVTAGSGAVTATMLNANTAFVGGAGNDVITINGLVYNGTRTLAGGNGTADRLVVNDAAAVTALTAANISGFEVLSITDDDDGAADAFNASTISGITAIRLAAISAADAVTVSALTAAQAANVTISGTQTAAPTLTLTGATDVGQIDTLSVTVDDLAAATVARTTITLADLTSAGVENVRFTANDHLTTTALTGLTGMQNLTVTGAGNVSLTSGALAFNPNTTIDASAVTGTVTVNLATATANGALIKGSSTAANIITGVTGQNDVIVGGTGVDTVTNTTGTDTLNFVSDSSADIFNVSVVLGRTTITNFDAATTTTSEDVLQISEDTVDGGEVVITGAGAQAALTDDRTYVIEQTLGAAGSLTTGSNTTLVAADFTAATLTNIAAFLAERYTDLANDSTDAVFVLNNGTNSYVYALNSSDGTTAIAATELTLVGVINSAVVLSGDVTQVA